MYSHLKILEWCTSCHNTMLLTVKTQHAVTDPTTNCDPRRIFISCKRNTNPNITQVSCFQWNNRLANLKIKKRTYFTVQKSNTLTFQSTWMTLWIDLLPVKSTYKTADYASTRGNIVHHLASSTCGARAQVLRTTALSLAYSMAEYCTPVWLKSVHNREIGVQISRAMRSISGTLMPISLSWFALASLGNIGLNKFS